MSYIGRGIDQIDNISTLDNLTFNGSDATFNLTQNSTAFVPVSADALQIQIDGIIQSGNYTVSGSTVTFDFTPSSSSVCNGIKHFGVGVLTSVSDGAVTQPKVGAEAINESKLQVSNSPTNGYMLTAQSGNTGGLTWAEAPSGGLVYLGGSESSSSAAAVTFDSVFSSTYRAYRIIGMIAPSTDTWIKFRLRASSSDKNSNEYINLERTSYITDGESQAQNNYGNHTATYGAFAQADIDSDSNAHYVAFDFTVYDPNTDVFGRHMINGTYSFKNGGSDKLYVGNFANSATANQNADGIKFETNAGTLSYHSIRVYGMVNS